MARFKKFAGGTNISDFEPLEFELNSQLFTCKPAIQGSVLLEFVRDADGDSGGDSAKALYNFLEAAMSKEEYAKLDAVLHNEEVIIDVELIGAIVSWLVEEYSARPTTPPGDSSHGQLTSGTSSTDEHSSQAAD